jgi:hypothetical protein
MFPLDGVYRIPYSAAEAKRYVYVEEVPYARSLCPEPEIPTGI